MTATSSNASAHSLKFSPPPLAEPRRPVLRLPANSCDAHCHVFGPFDRYPLPDDRSFDPSAAPESKLRQLHDHLGFSRAVIVQSQGHGFDHRPLLDALRDGGGRYKGVALVRPGDPDEVLERYDASGVCGARFNFLAHLGGRPDLDAVRTVAARIRPLGWHLAIHVSGQDIVEFSAFIRSLDMPVVIDHMARVDIDEGPDGPSVRALRALLDTGNVWVKLSGADRMSKAGAPFEDTLPVARRLAEHAPERVLWGSDWPHVNLSHPMPDDGDLVDLIAQIVPDERRRIQMLVDNPARFFGFR
ncbi:amidohydrolase family protein [Burkholderia multivorans]|uniref:amidohydrolase family protein n=1 Tax=Burkholderia multivorans TaxID=87883 RepID=UPI0013DFD111|nr:amidohydrolase family protein [Burkholderia multivorans]NGM75296.1 amidohydrolase family protein [Burkholderia multivorans]